MQDTKVTSPKEYFRYNLFINQKAIWETLVINQTHELIKSPTHIYVLSFLVAMHNSNSSIYVLEPNGIKYVYASDNFILGNLKFLSIKSRQLKNILNQLEKAGLIDRKVLNYNQRYVKINSDLLALWYSKERDYSAIGYLVRNEPELWKSIRKKWVDVLGQKEFENVIEWCNTEINQQGIPYKNINRIFSLINNTLAKWNKK